MKEPEGRQQLFCSALCTIIIAIKNAAAVTLCIRIHGVQYNHWVLLRVVVIAVWHCFSEVVATKSSSLAWVAGNVEQNTKNRDKWVRPLDQCFSCLTSVHLMLTESIVRIGAQQFSDLKVWTHCIRIKITEPRPGASYNGRGTQISMSNLGVLHYFWHDP